MKRIRGEHIQGRVGQYLKRRRYHQPESDEMDKKLPRTTRQSVREMALHKALYTEGSTGQCVSYSSISGDVTTCDQQYARLMTFINESVLPYQSELCDVIYPIFIHIFLELIINGHRAAAHKFFDRYHDDHLLDQSSRERQKMMDTLKHTYMRDDVLNNQLLTSFRDHKYIVFMKPETMDYLLRYLKSNDNMVLLQVFNQYLSVQMKEVTSRVEIADMAHHLSPTAKDRPHYVTSSSGGDVTMNSLQKCVQRVREGPPCVSSVCFYTFINTSEGLSSCAIAADKKFLCGGFESSVVKVWALTPQLLTRRHADVDVSRIHLSCDVVDDVTDDSKTSEMVTMRAHSGPVYKTAFLPDSNHLLSCSEDKTVRLWNLETFSNVVSYTGHNYPVWDLDVSDLGYFASCSQDKTARLWTTDRIYPLRTFIGHTLDVETVKFHPNGNYLATGSDDKTIRLWSVQEARTVRLLQGHRSGVNTLAFSPDGQYLASAGEDRRVRVWDLSSGQIIKDLRGHTDVVCSLAYSQDGTMLASGGLDSTLRVWDMKRAFAQSMCQSESCSPELLAAFPTKSTCVLSLRFSRHNVLLAAGAVQS